MWGRNDLFFGTSAAAFIGLFGSPGYNGFGGTQTTPSLLANANSSDATAFDRRQANTVGYWTPNFAGFSARVHYVPGEQKSSVAPLGYVAPQSLNPWMWSIAATYDRGAIYAAVGYEQHKDYFGTRVMTGVTSATGNASDDWGVRVMIGVQGLPRGLRLYGLYERLKYSTGGVVVTGQITDFRRDAFGIMGTYTFGYFVIRGGWAKAFDPACSAAGAICLDDGLGTNQYSLGVSYWCSKRTQVYIFGTKQANDTFARYKFGANTGPVSPGCAIWRWPSIPRQWSDVTPSRRWWSNASRASGRMSKSSPRQARATASNPAANDLAVSPGEDSFGNGRSARS